MKQNFTLLLILVIAGFSVNAQELKFAQVSETEMDKDVRKEGRYAGTFLNGNDVDVYYFLSSKNEGVQLIDFTFDNTLKFKSAADKFVSSEDASNEFAWYLPKEEVEKTASGNEQYLFASAAFGSGMKIESGKIVKEYFKGIYTGMHFDAEKKLKPKTGEIWRIQPSGYKTTSDIDAMATSNGFYKDLHKYGNPLLAAASSPLLAVGVITEKVSVKDPPKTHANRVAVLALDGNNFDDSKYNIYELPYAATTMSSGLGQDDNLSVLFAPLNAPTTFKPNKHFVWKEKKDHFTMMRFSDDYELVDSVSFTSKLMWGNFQIFNGQGSTFITGLGKEDFDGWARGNMQVKKLDAMQITQIKDGEVLFLEFFTEDRLAEKLVVPAGEKAKYSLAVTNNTVREMIPLPNGDYFFIGVTPEETWGLQLASSGSLKAFYRIPRIDAKSSKVYNYQVMFKGDNMYLVLNEQPYEFSNDAQTKTSTTRIQGAGVITTTTTTTVTKLNEVFVQSQLLRINTATLEMSNALIMDGKEFYTMGSFPAMFTSDAIYFTGREKGPGGKTLYVGRVDL